MIGFKARDLVVLISGRCNVYCVSDFYHNTDEVEITRYVDGEPRWMIVKCWQIRLATNEERKHGRRI